MSFDRCIICGNKMKEEHEYYDEDIYALCESESVCSVCGYSEEYAYGGSRNGVEGIAELIYTYNCYLTKQELKQYKKKLWKYRKFLLRTHKIKGRKNRL